MAPVFKYTQLEKIQGVILELAEIELNSPPGHLDLPINPKVDATQSSPVSQASRGGN